MLDAVRDMIAQNLFLDTPQRRSGGGDLRDDVDAIAVVLDHAGDAGDLALDAVQALGAGDLDRLSHDRYIPPMGIFGKTGRAR